MIGVVVAAAVAFAAAPDTMLPVMSVPDEVLALLDAVREGEGLSEEEIADLLEGPIDLSTVSQSRLAEIPFITGKEVQALLDLRERLGGRLALADLTALGRMGEMLSKRLAPFVRIGLRDDREWSVSLAHGARSGSSGSREVSEARFGWEARGGSLVSVRLYRGGPGTPALVSGAAALSGSSGRMSGRISLGGFRIMSLLGVISDGGVRSGVAGREWIPGGGASDADAVSRRSPPLAGAAATLFHTGDALGCGLLAFVSPARTVVTDIDAGLYVIAPARWGGSVSVHASQFDVSLVAVRTSPSKGENGSGVWSGGAELCMFRPGWRAAFEVAGRGKEGSACAAGVQCSVGGWECSLRFQQAGMGFIPPLSAPWSTDPLRSQESRIDASLCGSPLPWAEVRGGFRGVRKPSHARPIPLATERQEVWLAATADLTRSTTLTGGMVSSRMESGESSTVVSGAPAAAVRLLRGTVGFSFRPAPALELSSRVGFVRGFFPRREEGMVWTVEARLTRSSFTASLRFGAYDVDAYDARVSVYDPSAGLAGASVFLFTPGWCAQANLRWSLFSSLHLVIAYARYGPPPGRAGADSRSFRCALHGTL